VGVSAKTWDAVVVGGGPAGLAAAIAVRQRGLKVLVAEALAPPIDKACGEGLMPDSRRELAALGLELTATDGAEFDGIHFACQTPTDATGVTADFGSGRGLGIRRPQLHSRMVERAREIGVELAWGTHAELREGQPLRISDKVVKYGYLVGADGQSSLVRAWAGLGAGHMISRRFGLRKHFRLEPWTRHVEVHWGARGQVYVTPVGDDEICVATVARSAGLSFDDQIADVPFLQNKLKNATVTTRQRGAETTTRRLARVVSGNVALTGNVALIGDASGSADAVTGEGLALAFRQALLLANSVAGGSLETYQAGHGAILRVPQAMARVMLTMDRWPWFRDRAMRMLASDPALFARMLSVHVGEESIENFLLRSGVRVGWGMLAPPTAMKTALL
jgi:flavin-dependent dehydrogenase